MFPASHTGYHVPRRRQRSRISTSKQIKPSLKQELVDEGRLVEARSALRRVLARRGLVLSPKQDARIEACTNLSTLERWLDQAITAPSPSKALR